MNDLDIFESLGGLRILNLKSEAVEIESIWKDRRIALVFLRHFG